MITDSALFKIIIHIMGIPGIAVMCYVIFSKIIYKKGIEVGKYSEGSYQSGYKKGYEHGLKKGKGDKLKRSKFK